MSDEPFSREETLALQEQFRELKHSINNTLAVIMALSELGQRNPAHLERLAKTVLQRGPDVVNLLQNYQNSLMRKTPISMGGSEEAV